MRRVAAWPLLLSAETVTAFAVLAPEITWVSPAGESEVTAQVGDPRDKSASAVTPPSNFSIADPAAIGENSRSGD